MGVRLLPRGVIGQGVRGVRSRLGMSRAEFARALGLDRGGEETVRAWEDGQDQPDYGMLARIATMGIVDAIAFQGGAADEPLALPAGAPAGGVTAGEAAELQQILGQMEALMAQARAIVERAARRTPVESVRAEAEIVVHPAAGDGLDVEIVEVKAAPRKRAGSTGKGNGRASAEKSEGSAKTSAGAKKSSTAKKSPAKSATAKSADSATTAPRPRTRARKDTPAST